MGWAAAWAAPSVAEACNCGECEAWLRLCAAASWRSCAMQWGAWRRALGAAHGCLQGAAWVHMGVDIGWVRGRARWRWGAAQEPGSSLVMNSCLPG